MSESSILPSAHQTRWALDGFLVILSIVAIAVSAPSTDDNNDMFTGLSGDVRGLIVVLGSAGLIGTSVICLMRLFTRITPKIWAHYLDRLGFTFVALMWICWTSATMSFTLYTLDLSLCQYTPSIDNLPTCPILSFDLSFLHILSVLSFGQLLNHLSIALSSSGEEEQNLFNNKDGSFVMWELAINSNPPSPILSPISRRTLRNFRSQYTIKSQNNQDQDVPSLSPNTMGGYGSTSFTTIINNQPAIMSIQDDDNDNSIMPESPVKKVEDKFSQGRLWTYIPLNLCSLAVVCASFASIRVGEFTSSGISIFLVGFGGIFLSLGCLITHFAQKKAAQDEENDYFMNQSTRTLRKDRIFEVGFAGILFLIWPVSAILYTLFPPTPYQPCSNPSASAAPSPGEDYNIDPFPLCQLGITVVTLSWIGSWLLLTRIMGLIFPITKIESFTPSRNIPSASDNEENRALSSDSRPAEEARPSKKGKGKVNYKGKSSQNHGWERVTAGEEFELGSEEDE
ncbi:uncharacterized protein L201_001660 [Kwoniella dendrophila CBS 6074]|uniref:MARVEL domain-containing protein n=1 Tax=Kwoniella dendrophila CBS 6074 TaxID=1295534 RepID=A0AAX4JNY3_9TREE